MKVCPVRTKLPPAVVGWLVCVVCVCVCVPFSSVPTWLIHFLNMYYTFAKKRLSPALGTPAPLYLS
jgi:hypothetical protein